jgi:hypothetical protein
MAWHYTAFELGNCGEGRQITSGRAGAIGRQNPRSRCGHEGDARKNRAARHESGDEDVANMKGSPTCGLKGRYSASPRDEL